MFSGAVLVGVDNTSDFTCRDEIPADHAANVDAACVQQYGPDSRQVVLTATPSNLRCVPRSALLVGDVDFGLYCRTVFGANSRASLIASDYRGWRCAVVQRGIFETGDIDFEGNAVDLACQAATGAETYATVVDRSSSDGWRCYGAP